MDFLASRRFLTAAVVLLVAINMALAGVLWWQNIDGRNRSAAPRKGGYGRNLAARPELKLNESQKLSFIRLQGEHFRQAGPQIREIMDLKKALVEEAVKSAPDTSKIGRIADEIGVRQSRLERNLARHFNQLSMVCTPEQRDSLKKVLGKFSAGRYGRAGYRNLQGPGPQMNR